MTVTEKLISELNLKPFQVENTVKLLDEGNTVPFISRYRKEATGSLDDQTVRLLSERLTYLRNMEETREKIKAAIDEQGALSEELSLLIDNAETL
ncbi:MAG: RNA-binding transcriptional accessory protein, partial [Clostridia bacterium]|nr:RNA-binding transcriptional accessory protein [Clostridia bacterium]